MPFCHITSQISGEEYVTVSAIKPLLYNLMNTIKEDQSAGGEQQAWEILEQAQVVMWQTARKAILDDLSSRYQGSLVTMLLCSASFMDPRFKSLPFVSVDYKKEVHANVKQQAINLISKF